MKKRRIAALMAAAAMTMANAMSVSAYDVTIEEGAVTGDTTPHTYAAYQVLSGTVDTDNKTLTNIAAGANLDTDAFTVASGYASINAFLTAFSGAEDDTDALQKAAAAFGASLKGNPEATTTTNEFTGLKGGYYLIKDTTELSNKDDANSRFLLKVVGDTTVTTKRDIPKLDKKIVKNDTKVDADTKSIGDTVKYELSSKVPDMTGYNKYYFIMNDTMCKGLTFNKNDVTIKVGKTTLGDDDYTITSATDTNGVTNIKIVFDNFLQYKDQVGADVIVNYTATLNKDADRTTKGNDNKANLTYSNNPNHTYFGDNEPDEEKDKDVVGKTADVITKVYTTGIAVIKVDSEDTTKRLAGAKFKLSGKSLNTTITTGKTFTKDDEGTYYLLKNGTYTETAPDTDTADKYADTEQKYSLAERNENNASVKNKDDATVMEIELEVDSEGYLTFEGLGAGTYTLEETAAPKGYNKSNDKKTIVIDATPSKTAPNWTVSVDGKDVTPDEGAIITTLKVENSKGITLPGTGGIGTTIFYVVGSLCVAAGAVMTVFKRKNTAK
ncbi:MAG: isopeptide-forming domain-containing fimbrial protein [Ruminococcus sp.]|nr:isopeptide-forming domain-containing fimbrial protein [Ruminococcus sp.]